MKKLLTLFIAISLCGCATQFVRPDRSVDVPKERIYVKVEEKSQALANVVFVRDSGFAGSGVYQHLYINGVRSASLDPSEKVEFNLPEGEYVFGVKPTDPFGTYMIHGISQTLKPGKHYLYRLMTDGTATMMMVQRVIQ